MRIKDIAEMAGVSSAMVSRVINNSGYVSREKRAKIENIIKTTGFQLNQQARSLRTRRTGLIASVIPALDSTYIIDIQQNLVTQLEEMGYHVIITTWRRSTGSVEVEELLRELCAKGVDGIILFHDQVDEKMQVCLENMKTPVVLIDEQVEGLPCICSAQKEAGYELCQLAAQKGFYRIAYLNAPTLKEARGVEEYSRKHPEAGLELIPIDINLHQDHTNLIREVAAKVVGHQEKPEVLISFSDRIAVGVQVYAQIHECPIRCVGVGNTPITRLVQPPLTTVDLHPELLTRQIVQQIHHMITVREPETVSWKNTLTLIRPENLK